MNTCSHLFFTREFNSKRLSIWLASLLLAGNGLFAIEYVNAQTSTSQTIQITSKSPAWSQLRESERAILSPLESDWESLSPDRKQKWVQVAQKFEKLPSNEQERLLSRMTEWVKLSTNERRIARDNYLQSLNIPAEKKAEAWQAYQQLSPEEKKKLAEGANKKPSLVNSPSLKSK